MFDYPPIQGAYVGRYGDAASRMHTLIGMAKKRRFDISIGLQSALSTVYAVELVFYFVRSRHLANKHLAAWRASLMLILLVVDIGLIWLTVRSKRSVLAPVQQRATHRYNAEAFQGYANHDAIRATLAPSAPLHMPELPPYQVLHSGMDLHHEPPATHQVPLNNPFASHENTRSHLNTPITG
ncbi:hypothetical protein LPJ77_000496 [Coemansia sp. RSA 2523]|nr:hypothetical protein LPJ54_000252 [Coemansia sp. RSA 1824]KAJ1810957.1 hypothetical protein LPJ77_000496 [Coemansia sp. RSA 2523]KAJ2138892.1 hypothetical protein GGH17_000870 [Coemansia sp. RSA 788]KAJ2148610.1 hypothetical protein IW142_000773 [Coemansia sp. RSA 564]KAJ2154893.1 hypothetical protein J3F82_000805 [Coemansia sp. RSA 637]KAJ2168661.1 hypothetical protein GGH15_001188 [Coemansia sp. RSA 562]KAJ2168745.1 hypothetical protein GGH16_003701 [Coemansia sp. RSA 560]KAJ2180568.1 h